MDSIEVNLLQEHYLTMKNHMYMPKNVYTPKQYLSMPFFKTRVELGTNV